MDYGIKLDHIPIKCDNTNAIKRMFKYLSGSLHLGLWYPRNSSFDLISYSEANFASSLLDRKSTSGTCQFLGQCLVSWFSKK